MSGSEILTPRSTNGINVEYGAIHFINDMLLGLPKHALSKLKTVSSGVELRDALSDVIETLNEVKSLSTVKSIFDVRMSEIAIKTVATKILMENNYFGHEILLNGDLPLTAMQWARAMASQDGSNYDKKVFKLLLDITADVNSGEIVVGPNGRIVENNREPGMRTSR